MFMLDEVKKNIIIFQKENGNTFTLFIIFIVKSSKIAQIYYCDPQSAGINVQSPQSESTPRRLNSHTIQLNDYETDPYFLQLRQNMATN